MAVPPAEAPTRTVECPVCHHSHTVLTAGEIGKIRVLRARVEKLEAALREIVDNPGAHPHHLRVATAALAPSREPE